jgi:hypothetical protein
LKYFQNQKNLGKSMDTAAFGVFVVLALALALHRWIGGSRRTETAFVNAKGQRSKFLEKDGSFGLIVRRLGYGLDVQSGPIPLSSRYWRDLQLSCVVTSRCCRDSILSKKVETVRPSSVSTFTWRDLQAICVVTRCHWDETLKNRFPNEGLEARKPTFSPIRQGVVLKNGLPLEILVSEEGSSLSTKLSDKAECNKYLINFYISRKSGLSNFSKVSCELRSLALVARNLPTGVATGVAEKNPFRLGLVVNFNPPCKGSTVKP